MLIKPKTDLQLGFYSTLADQLDRHHPLYRLAHEINWKIFEEAFTPLYCQDNGRPAKPIRLMVSLLLLKHIRNISDESVVEQWSENAYYQYLSGESVFQAKAPCEASELVHFRHRIGEKGIELIFKESIRINGKAGQELQAVADTTVQEKNITYPTDNKLHRKIIKHCLAIADQEGVAVRQRYTRVLKKLAVEQRFRGHRTQAGRARKADRKVKTIAGRLVRELERQLPISTVHEPSLALFKKVLAQKKADKQKIYSLHEPHVQCIGKGKAAKKYEFGNKVSVMTTKNSGVIIGAISFEKNSYDGHTLQSAIEQQQRLSGITLEKTYVDRGYQGVKEVLGTAIVTPKALPKEAKVSEKRKMREGFRRRAAIEPKIGHLKSDHRLGRNFYKGIVGDSINVMLAAAAMNFKRMMNIYKNETTIFCRFFFRALAGFFQPNQLAKTTF
jgi:transposase, IS5 family